MASLKKGGFGNSKIFSADDLKGRSPEELGDMVSGTVPTTVVLYVLYILGKLL
jgi:hypothetical protein